MFYNTFLNLVSYYKYASFVSVNNQTIFIALKPKYLELPKHNT